jgi:preprotein translocase subunit SecA
MDGKYQALVRKVSELHAIGRPVLIGTATILESQRFASLLSRSSIPFRVLNATNDDQEAAIIAESGAIGAVTISTNMAGRGTDIRLGGRDERDSRRVRDLGGLLVIGTNRHESRRVDDQLRGRAGRQGEPGETCFFISVEDDLLVRYGMGEVIANSNDTTQDGLVTSPRVAQTIAHMQRVIEGESFEIRRTLRRYSIALESQRRQVRDNRRHILTGEERVDTLVRGYSQRLFERLASLLGPEQLEDVDRRIVLRAMDLAWSDHLETVAEIRNNIHLVSMGGFSAFDEFNLRVNQSFQHFAQATKDHILAILRKIDATPNESDVRLQCQFDPSATWTYMINDNPTGDVTMRLSRAIRRVIGR